MEMLAAVAVIAIVAAIAATKLGDVAAKARATAAEADLTAIRAAFLDEEAGYLRDMAGIAGFSPAELRLANLLVATNLYGLADSPAGEYPRGRRVDEAWLGDGVARPSAFTSWDEAHSRGWRGPYLRGVAGVFPSRADATGRGFFPDVSHLYVPDHFANHREVSIYGFPGEPALLDPWGNPYVLQIPPPQAFTNANMSSVSPETRFSYARIVSAGPDGKLDTPCFFANETNDVTVSVWSERSRRLARQAGLIDGDDRYRRGDDLVLFLMRNDIDEGEAHP